MLTFPYVWLPPSNSCTSFLCFPHTDTDFFSSLFLVWLGCHSCTHKSTQKFLMLKDRLKGNKVWFEILSKNIRHPFLRFLSHRSLFQTAIVRCCRMPLVVWHSVSCFKGDGDEYLFRGCTSLSTLLDGLSSSGVKMCVCVSKCS